MHGREGEERRLSRHMLPVPGPAKAAVVAPPPPPPTVVSNDSDRSYPGFFLKDGRKIYVGDCALFQSGNSPAFIGIIRWFSKQDLLKLGVNWLYRPADLKLAKGILLEAAPNEVFYSFHQDEISAESLLHPCKVAFLRKGVELPSGISSFVCRRVYDIANKCLWWLTDQDYINEHQEEVDELLDKTQLEMHAEVQSGGRSPKSLGGPTSTQQLKSGSDSVQNSGTSGPLQGKGKRREKAEQSFESIRRDRSSKADDGDSGNFTLDSKIRAEVAKITDQGGLVDTRGVEKLLSLMQLDRGERKIDLSGRLLLADVIAATDSIDCLGRFVQLRGVLVLDDWLHEAHKGKIGDGSSSKGCDKSVEELLLVLLRALDRLPVDLHALKTSSIGKSVNNLRSHKNHEISKKARSLVDTWKKRVNDEMAKGNDAKSVGTIQPVSWSGKPSISEASHGPKRHSGEAPMKTSAVQPSSFKNLPIKPCHGETGAKSLSASLGSSKLPSSMLSSVPICSKDAKCKPAGTNGSAELASVNEEKSSGSSQSQNNSQSCSSAPVKTIAASWKEDVRSPTTGSVHNSKTSGSLSRHRKSSNGSLGTIVSGSPKDSCFGKSSNRNLASNKGSLSGQTCERMLDSSVSDCGSGHRLIVRLPNPSRTSAQTTSGGSPEEPSMVASRAPSPAASEKHDQSDQRIKVRGDACQTSDSVELNAVPLRNNVKKRTTVPDEYDRLLNTSPKEHKNSSENGTAESISKASRSSSADGKGPVTDSKSGKPCCPNLTPINALIESCVKYSEASASLSVGDDLGMNLLASVATEEMSKSELMSPNSSSFRSSPTAEGLSISKEEKTKVSSDDKAIQGPDQHDGSMDVDHEPEVNVNGSHREKSQNSKVTNSDIDMLHEHKLLGESDTHTALVSRSGEENTDKAKHMLIHQEHKKEEDAKFAGTSQLNEISNELGKITDGLADTKRPVANLLEENNSCECACETSTGVSMTKSVFTCSSASDVYDAGLSVSCKKPENEVAEETPSCHVGMDLEKSIVKEGSEAAIATEKQPSAAAATNIKVQSSTDELLVSSGSGSVDSENANVLKLEKSDDSSVKNHLESANSEKKEQDNEATKMSDTDQLTPDVLCGKETADDSQRKEALEHLPGSTSHEDLPEVSMNETEQCTEPVKLSIVEANNAGYLKFCGQTSLAPENASKLDFDLNEGILAEEINPEEVAMRDPGCPSAVCPPSAAAATDIVSSVQSGCPVPITVAAPAKGPFVPPENLSKSKSEPGWKGSAATSAFRPAEPRKNLEMPLNMSETSSTTGSGRQSRPSLNIDLNVADERHMEDIASQTNAQGNGPESGCISIHGALARSSGGLELDLNKADEGTENGQDSASTNRKLEPPQLPVRPASVGFTNGDTIVLRDFDLNNGPGVDEVGAELVQQKQYTKNNSMLFIPQMGSLRMNNTELGSSSPWYHPQGSVYYLPDRGNHPYPIVPAAGAQRYLGSAAVGSSFGGDFYRGPVLSSSPATAFTATAAFPHSPFPFPATFPSTSTSFPGGSTTYLDSTSGACITTVPSQIISNAAPSPYVRPYMIMSETCGGVSGSVRDWGRQNLDLNAGPGSSDVDGRFERLPSASHQLSAAAQQASLEEQTRMNQVPGGGFKRKEPEGGWDTDRFTCNKQSPWQ